MAVALGLEPSFSATVYNGEHGCESTILLRAVSYLVAHYGTAGTISCRRAAALLCVRLLKPVECNGNADADKAHKERDVRGRELKARRGRLGTGRSSGRSGGGRCQRR